jgi:hypothetical protein
MDHVSYIDNFGRPDNPVVDITGSPLSVDLNYKEKGANLASSHFVNAINASQLPGAQSLLPFLTQPLNQVFDKIWSQDKDQDGNTMRDRTTAIIVAQIQNAVRHSANDVKPSVPMTGILRAVVSGQIAILSYDINNVSIDFAVAAISLNLTLDIELLVLIDVPPQPGAFTAKAVARTGNAAITTTNIIGQIAQDFGDLANFTQDQPPIFQGAEGRASTAQQPPQRDLAGLSTLLSSLSTPELIGAAYKAGFNQLGAYIKLNPPSLVLQYRHPMDGPPVLTNAAETNLPTFFRPILGTTATDVNAGSVISITGAYFPIGQASDLYIGWSDTTSGEVTLSRLSWGAVPTSPFDSPDSHMIPIARDVSGGPDGKNVFHATGLKANAQYWFQVADEDLLTATPLSQTAFFWTEPSGQVDLLLVREGLFLRPLPPRNLGTVPLTGTDRFAANVLIPADTTPGDYSLLAVFMGRTLAGITLSVAPAGQQLPPKVAVIDADSNTEYGSVEQGFPLTLRAVNFQRNTAVSVFIDTTSGTLLDSVIADPQGSFEKILRWPVSPQSGNHNIVAQQIVNGRTLQATVSVLVQRKPQ